MKAEDVKIGMRVKYTGSSSVAGKPLGYATVVSACANDPQHFKASWDVFNGKILHVHCSMLEPAEEIPTKPPIDLHNCKINVQAYAEQYKISLEEAHKEIQQYLFDNGCLWIGEVTTHSMFGLGANYLFVEDNKITHESWSEIWEKQNIQEVTFSRNISLTPQLVSPVPVFVECNGKKYDKKLFEKAIDGLEAVE